METNCKETVTISLTTFKQMESELNKLREEVKEKEVIRYIKPDMWEWFILGCSLIAMGFLLYTYFKLA